MTIVFLGVSFDSQARSVFRRDSTLNRAQISTKFQYRQDIYIAQWSRLKHLAAMGDAKAQFRLGNLYYSPPEKSGIAQSYKKAFQLFLASAKQGNPHSQHNLAVLYLKGQGIERDQKKALAWFLIAAENGSKSAKRTVAKFSAEHINETQSLKQALEKKINKQQYAK